MAIGSSSVPVSSPPPPSSSQMGRSFTRTASTRRAAATDGGGGQGSELTQIEESSAEEHTEIIAEAATVREKVHVAVGKEVKEAKANFAWVLRSTPRDTTIVVVHVHCPATMIPMSKLFSARA